MFETVAGWVVWGLAVIGYISILALTEQSAAHYVADRDSQPIRRTSICVITSPPAARTSAAADSVIPVGTRGPTPAGASIANSSAAAS